MDAQGSFGMFGSASTLTANVPTLPHYFAYPNGVNQGAAPSSTADIDPPGVSRELQTSRPPICLKQAAVWSAGCLPRPPLTPMIEPYMQTPLIPGSSALSSSNHVFLSAGFTEENPPGVGEVPSVTVMSSTKASAAHLRPLSQAHGGNFMAPLLAVPYRGMAPRVSGPSYGFYSEFPLPPPLPPPMPQPPLPPPPPLPRHIMYSGLAPQMLKKSIIFDKEKLTLFVGKVVPSLSDKFLTSILELCGPIQSWTRAQDPVTGSPKGFGFCKYESPESLLRALRLLNRLKLEGQEIMVKVDQTTLNHLELYVDEKIKWLKAQMSTEAENAPGLEATTAVKQLRFDVPREVPVEERLGWFCYKENEIDKEVCKKLVDMLEQRDRMESLHLPSNGANTELDVEETDEDYEQGSPSDENWQRVKLTKWKQFDYALERFKLKVQGAHGTPRSSESCYLEFQKLWEERERAKENEQNMERERAEAAREMRQKLLIKQEKSSRSHKRVCYDEKYKKRFLEREKDSDDRIEEQRKSVSTTAISSGTSKDNHLPTGGLSQNRFLDLSTRAKIAICFKSSSKQRQVQLHRPIVESDSFWGGAERSEESQRQQRPVLSSVHYRNPTFILERESTPEECPSIPEAERSPDSNKPNIMHSEKLSAIPEKKMAFDAKELIDSIPRTKNEIFSFCMDWSKFDENHLHERIRPWVSKKISEFLGEEEETLVDFIVTSAKKHMTPTHLLELLENIFVEEAELFVVKLWRMVIYELRKVECGFSGG